jgi:hypothetical protein
MPFDDMWLKKNNNIVRGFTLHAHGTLKQLEYLPVEGRSPKGG